MKFTSALMRDAHSLARMAVTVTGCHYWQALAYGIATARNGGTVPDWSPRPALIRTLSRFTYRTTTADTYRAQPLKGDPQTVIVTGQLDPLASNREFTDTINGTRANKSDYLARLERKRNRAEERARVNRLYSVLIERDELSAALATGYSAGDIELVG